MTRRETSSQSIEQCIIESVLPGADRMVANMDSPLRRHTTPPPCENGLTVTLGWSGFSRSNLSPGPPRNLLTPTLLCAPVPVSLHDPWSVQASSGATWRLASS